MYRTTIRLTCSFVIAVSIQVAPATAAMFLHWDMNGTLPQAMLDSVGTNHLTADGTESNGGPATVPTYLPTGGVNNSGAFEFNPSGVGADLLQPTTQPTMLHPSMPSPNGNANFNFTASFWIKTTDTVQRSTANGSVYAFRMPVFGDWTGQWAFEIGIDGGKAAFMHYDHPNTEIEYGVTNIADGEGHYVTFVHRDTGFQTGEFDIYVDGVIDVAGLDAHDISWDLHGAGPGNGRYRINDIGRMNADTQTVGRFILDDVRLFDTALTANEVFQLFAPPPVPEPSTFALLGLGMAGPAIRARRRRRAMA